MKFSYNYFSPLKKFVRNAEDEARKSCNVFKSPKKPKTPKHVVKKRPFSACKSSTPNSRTIIFKQKPDLSLEIATNDFLKNTFNLLEESLEKETMDKIRPGVVEESLQNIQDSSKYQPLETFFRSRRSSIKEEVKFIFDEDKTKSSCMVQTEESSMMEKHQPSFLKLIHKSRTTSKVKVPRDLSSSLSIKKYTTPSRTIKSTRFFICRDTQSIKICEKSEDTNRKDQLLTPTRIKIKIEKKVWMDQTCKTLNLTENSSLFNGKSSLNAYSHFKKNSFNIKNERSKKTPSSCKSNTPIRFNFGN